ncbi:site-specific DNA-methyltransferase [Rhizobium leguminosarum]
MSKKTKLELTWIGKDEHPKLEPRILIEDPDKSYHASVRHSEVDIFDNMLVHGDNLLALKALESGFEATIQAIYIDPPFNTGEAFEHYDDGLEHSIWLSMMRDRLTILHRLLHESGSLFLHIDDNELGYIIPLCDEIFGRSNRISIVSFKQSSVSGPKARNPGVVNISSFILLYAKCKPKWKNKNVYRSIPRDSRYNTFIRNFDAGIESWEFVPLSQGIEDVYGIKFKDWERDAGKNFERKMERFVLAERDRVVQLVSVSDSDVNADARENLAASRREMQVFHSPRADLDDYYFYNGKQIAFYRSKVREINGSLTTAERVSTLWDDLLSNNVHKEGGVRLPNGKKPEALIRRCLEMCTDPGDWVFDSFLGSGTTAAVAHKMRRRWIGVELREQANTHCLPRLRGIIDGTDLDGVTMAEGWKGGGGFRFFNLAPSLLQQDRYGNWVISKEYRPEMLSEAMCKHLGFTYAPSQHADEYWSHGYSTEKDFIYVTTQQLTHDACRKIAEDVGPERSLLVCCKAFNADPDKFDNLTLVKIPSSILTKCEWGRDDYSLNIANLPLADQDSDEVDDPSAVPVKRGRKSKASSDAELSLFDTPGSAEE